MNVFSWAASAVLGSHNPSVPGAIDIIAIKHVDGTIECSPFHVKLTNKSRDRSKLVKLRVNGVLTPVTMRLGPAGEAFFLERTPPPVADSLLNRNQEEASNPVLLLQNLNSNQNDPECFPTLQQGVNTSPRIRSLSLGDIDAAVTSDVHPTNTPRPAALDQLLVNEDLATAECAQNTNPLSTSIDQSTIDPSQRVRSRSEFSASDLSILSSVANRFLIQWREAPNGSPMIANQGSGSDVLRNASSVPESIECGDRSQHRRKAPVWTWTWGDLPVKTTSRTVDSSTLELYSLPKINETEVFLPDFRAIPDCQETSWLIQTIGEDTVAADKDAHTTLTRDAECREADSEAKDEVVYLQHQECVQSDVVFANRQQDSFTDFRIFSLCGHILAQSSGAPEPPPHNSQELRAMLSSYAIAASDMTISLITDPTVVTIIDDFLLPVGVAFLLLESVRIHSNANVVNAGTHIGEFTVTESSVRQSMEDYAASVIPPDSPEGIVADYPIWAGQRISQWGSVNRSRSSSATSSSQKSESLQRESSSEMLTSLRFYKRLDTSHSHENILKAFVDFEHIEVTAQQNMSGRSDGISADALHQADADDKLPIIASQCGHGEAFPQLETNISSETIRPAESVGPGDRLDPPMSIETEQSDLALFCEDIPFDAISPEPAGGDFYDSDTDSYLSLSLEDGESGESFKKYKYRKVLMPSQESLHLLALKDGENEIIFELDGCSPIRAQLFVWPETCKIVVIDIEGAIAVTKMSRSMFGLFLGSQTLVHNGVADMLNSIAGNGYRILYIAQNTSNSQSSKDHLSTIVAGSNSILPPGPIFQSPDSLVRGFGADRTDLFKAAALRGLKGLFPSSHNPYYACFCTRLQDTVVFSRYGVSDGRIFIVSESGEIRNINRTFRRTFNELTRDTEIVFPPLADSCSASSSSAASPATSGVADDSYSDFNYWRAPPPVLIL